MKKHKKWQLVCDYGEATNWMHPFIREFQFGIMKFKSFPEEGGMIEKKHYAGFFIKAKFFVPIIFK